MLKTVNKLEIEENFLKLVRASKKKLQLLSHLIMKDWMLSLRVRDKTGMSAVSTFI